MSQAEGQRGVGRLILRQPDPRCGREAKEHPELLGGAGQLGLNLLHSPRAALRHFCNSCALCSRGKRRMKDFPCPERIFHARRIPGPLLTPQPQCSAINEHSCAAGRAFAQPGVSRSCPVPLSLGRTEGEAPTSSCLPQWPLDAGKAMGSASSRSYLGKLKAFCQLDGQRFWPEWSHWHFPPSGSITPKGLQFHF